MTGSHWVPTLARYRRIVAAPAAFTALTALYVVLNLWLVAPDLGPGLSDFTYYHLASRAVLGGQSPYTLPNHINPPLLSFLMLPFALLPYQVARWAWFAISHLLIVVAAVWTSRALGADRTAALSVAAVWACAGSVAINLRSGQINPLLLLLLCMAIWPAQRGGWTRPVAIGVAAALKLFPGIVAIGDGLAGRLRGFLRSSVAVAGCLAIPTGAVALLLSGPVWPTRAGFWAGTPGVLNCSVPGFVLRLLDPPTTGQRLPTNWLAGHNTEMMRLPAEHAAISVAVSAVLLLVGVTMVWLVLRRSSPDVSLAGLEWTLVALALAAAPVAWEHYQILLLPGVARLACGLSRRRAWVEMAVLALAFVAVNWLDPLARGVYLRHYGRMAGPAAIVWPLVGMAPAGSVALFVLHLRHIEWPLAFGRRNLASAPP